jgi:hypothetical protein
MNSRPWLKMGVKLIFIHLNLSHGGNVYYEEIYLLIIFNTFTRLFAPDTFCEVKKESNFYNPLCSVQN